MSASRPYKEQALLFGARRSLVGVITQPAPAVAAPDRPAVVILNSGIVHRVGANRLTVNLARTLAGSGMTVCRFDLSGIGDSEPRGDGLSPLDSVLADMRDVLDALASTRGINRFILGGLCSGADHSLVYSGADPRVVGAFLLDPSLPRTLKHHLLHYRSRLLHAESWLNLARGRNPLLRAVKNRVKARLEALVRPAPPSPARRTPRVDDPEVREFLDKAYRAALGGGVQLLAILTGENRYYREQILDAFPTVPWRDQLRLEFFQESDHMFTAQAHCAKVIEVIGEWTRQTAFRGAP